MTWHSSDELRTLVGHCLTGNQSAMLALVERFRGQVLGLCYRMLGQRQDAEDAAQETFVRVLKNLHRWACSRDFMLWLFTIAGNRCRTALAGRRRRPTVELAEDAVADHRPDQGPGQLLAEEVRQALLELRGEYRRAFLLFHDQELSYPEIAQAMGVPLGTIK